MAIGPTLQEARLKKQLTPSQVAEITRMKVQLVEDLEKDDFHRIAATIYGKGFIKLFAECVDLDPKPLIADYVRSVQGDKPSLIPDGATVPPPEEPEPLPPAEEESPVEVEAPVETEAPEEEPEEEEDTDLFAYAKTKRRRIVPDRPASQPSVAKAAIAEKAGAAGEAVKQSGTKAVDACRHTMETLGNRLTDFRWGDAPLKVIGVVIGILVVLLFVISGVSNCMGRHSDRTVSDDTMRLAVDPPEPYFD